MHFYLLRRHRRPLLLPPGLLALAGLLWLGSIYIRQDVRLTHYSIFQLFCNGLSGHNNGEFWESPEAVTSLRQWQEFRLTGSTTSDTVSIRRIAQVLKKLHHANASSYGLKIVFDRHSKYKDFIALLNAITKAGIRKYTFETRLELPVLYVLGGTEPVHYYYY
ncbi:hypothetical protein Q5H92_08415 [Hymenobacter sp. M29]|uniref:Uncharacterized protein n=1 Tax=Hymenobacter mellowenesis TaxID=3063995 RepID=A0ABT9A964_9BACT|nr:hypothetical protein [Hymenobacter sp. M29]MDO7846376.1 hypothetical protein [Hymenobacter sp. M29]